MLGYSAPSDIDDQTLISILFIQPKGADNAAQALLRACMNACIRLCVFHLTNRLALRVSRLD